MIEQVKAADLEEGDRVRGYTGIPFPVGTLTVEKRTDGRIYWKQKFPAVKIQGVFDVERQQNEV